MDLVANPHELNQLHRAVLVGSAELTQAVLAGGTVEIDQRNSCGATPLMMAVHNGHSRIAKKLIKKGANVSMADKQGFTALHFCCAREEDDAIVKLLAKAGADLDAIIPGEGSTPLHRATHHGNSKVVRALIEAGANPDSQLPDGSTALHIAAEEGQVAVMRELLRGKANPLLIQTSPSGNTTVVPLDLAAKHGHTDVVRELIQELGIEGCYATSAAGAHALAFAASKQHLDIMAILTGAGVVDKGKALYLAAGMGHEASVKFLLRHRHKEGGCGVEGAYLNAREINGYTPLVVCIQGCFSQAPRIVRMLVDAGAATSPVQVMNLKGGVIFNDTPLAFTELRLREKIVADDKPATKEHLDRLEAIRRLLLRVDAVHAVSWLWPSGGPFIGRVTETDPEPPLPALKLMMSPILKQRTKRRCGLVATLLRYSVKT